MAILVDQDQGDLPGHPGQPGRVYREPARTPGQDWQARLNMTVTVVVKG
jgi:hypothetical protein